MKRVFIIHGWGGYPEEGWLPWLKKELENKGFKVFVPEMPNTDEPKIETWVNFLSKLVKTADKDTYFVGHSVGCQTILRYLEKINLKVGGAILVAPWMHLDEKTIEEEGEEVKEIAKPWMEISINFNKVKNNCNKFVCIFSNDDCYVPISDSKIFKKELDAEIIVENKKGHFTEDDGIKELQIALYKLLEISKS